MTFLLNMLDATSNDQIWKEMKSYNIYFLEVYLNTVLISMSSSK
jgi:hypothetical protein